MTSSNSANSDASSAIGSSSAHRRDAASVLSSPSPTPDFLGLQARLQAEARLALAQVFFPLAMFDWNAEIIERTRRAKTVLRRLNVFRLGSGAVRLSS
jgi:hypothetical protein